MTAKEQYKALLQQIWELKAAHPELYTSHVPEEAEGPDVLTVPMALIGLNRAIVGTGTTKLLVYEDWTDYASKLKGGRRNG